MTGFDFLSPTDFSDEEYTKLVDKSLEDRKNEGKGAVITELKEKLKTISAKEIDKSFEKALESDKVVAFSMDQPPPIKNKKPAVWDLVIEEMMERDEIGRKRYGTPLQPDNGRDALKDAYSEALDLVVYLRQAIYERDGK